jgi:hypothetical protein
VKLGLCLLVAFCISTAAVHAQGCAQCRDNMQATPPSVQQAYRHTIELLAISGVTVFAGGALLLRRYR